MPVTERRLKALEAVAQAAREYRAASFVSVNDQYAASRRLFAALDELDDLDKRMKGLPMINRRTMLVETIVQAAKEYQNACIKWASVWANGGSNARRNARDDADQKQMALFALLSELDALSQREKQVEEDSDALFGER